MSVYCFLGDISYKFANNGGCVYRSWILRKSMCIIKFGNDSKKLDILLNGKVFQWESFKHVGNMLNPSLHDKDDIQLKWQESIPQ